MALTTRAFLERANRPIIFPSTQAAPLFEKLLGPQRHVTKALKSEHVRKIEVDKKARQALGEVSAENLADLAKVETIQAFGARLWTRYSLRYAFIADEKRLIILGSPTNIAKLNTLPAKTIPLPKTGAKGSIAQSFDYPEKKPTYTKKRK